MQAASHECQGWRRHEHRSLIYAPALVTQAGRGKGGDNGGAYARGNHKKPGDSL